MFKCLCILLLIAFPPRVAGARPADSVNRLPLLENIETESRQVTGVASLSQAASHDTVFFGGTFWAADSNRWEAIRGGIWTFDSGVGSALGPTGPNKPAGYHTLMEGWYGHDFSFTPLPYFRRSSTCAIAGSFSFWAGVTAAEATGLCFAAGQGYGNGWTLEIRKSFAYGGTGNAILSYQYAYDIEPGFDYAYSIIDTTGAGAAPDIVLATYDGVGSGTANLNLVRGATLRTTAGPVILKFRVNSDGSYSDEDGLYATVCGAFAVDNISLSGAIVDFSDFEAGDNGWVPEVPVTGIGDFSNIVDRNTELPPPVTFCACGIVDSALVFYDELLGHPDGQDNLAISPWIDLARGGDAGRPGKIIRYHVYAEMPLANYIFAQALARSLPGPCPGSVGSFTQGPIFYYGEAPFCGPPGSPTIRDFSGVIGAGAQQVQLAVGVVSLCATSPFGVPCTGVSNTTPWFDNIALGVFGTNTAPNLSILTFDFLQDNFATDGTLNPGSPGRFDANTIKNGSTPAPGTILRDTLVARGDGGNTEVRLVFRVRSGPFTNGAALGAWAAQWTPEPSLGAGWYSARMDTAEQGGNNSLPRAYMTTFHEADPGFSGTDRTPDPNDPSQLENEILPDHILTAGSRIDYFVAARYLPPDPRNPGGTAWFIVPDTTGGRYAEVEILPSSMAPDSSWNCTLYVDHHHDRNLADQALEEAGLTASLGGGGNNAEGTRYDRFDNQTPSSGQLSFGRPVQTKYGASIIQAFAYKNIVWHGATLSSLVLTDEDANILGPWLTLRGVGNNRFWGSGSGLSRSMSVSGEPSTVNFMRTVLGALNTCNTVRDVNCPNGTGLDSTYCLPTTAVAGSVFTTTTATSVRGNGCPELESFDLLNRNASVATSKGQLDYVKLGMPTSYASVTNFNTLDVNYKTVLDGMAVGRLRNMPVNPNNPAFCNGTAASTGRTDNVLDWFGSPGTCKLPAGLVDVPGEGTPAPPRFRTSLGHAYPNPMNPTTRIQFTNGLEGGRVTLQIFDVTGRLVKSILDGKMAAGPHEVTWDGRSDDGASVASGLYFYRLRAENGGFSASQKLMVMK